MPALYANPRFRGEALTEVEERWRVMTNLVSWFAGVDRWNEVWRNCERGPYVGKWGWFAEYLLEC